MKFLVRVLLGFALGAGAVLALGLTVGTFWLAATVGALASAVGFLGSFFVWSADRPEEGYEQVLFDRPNTLITFGMMGLMVLAGFGTSVLGGAGGPSWSPEEKAALAAMDEQHDAARIVQNKFVAARDLSVEGELPVEDLAEQAQALSEEIALVQEALAALDVPPRLAAAHEAATAHADLVRKVLDDAVGCVAGDMDACTEGRLALADAIHQLQAYEKAVADAAAAE